MYIHSNKCRTILMPKIHVMYRLGIIVLQGTVYHVHSLERRRSVHQWWRDLFRCRIDLLNFSMVFNILAPYMEFLHLNWYIAEWHCLCLCPIICRHICLQSCPACNITVSPILTWYWSVMNAKHIEGGVELCVPVSWSRIMWLIPSTCYTQNLVCPDSSHNIPLVNAWVSRNVYGYLEIKGPSFYMFSIHMCGKDVQSQREWVVTWISPLTRNHVILMYYAHPIQRILTYQILCLNRVRKVLDGIV